MQPPAGFDRSRVRTSCFQLCPPKRQSTRTRGLRNISAILDAAGSSLEKAVSATLIVADEEDFAGANEEWLKWFPNSPPARQGAKMPVRIVDTKVSIEA